mmetsp:Transcript_63877/g.139070  ORF Transcript_63877/g.139070 Transcript_63877/m.139070 type:complete len:278 (-) Transcript_63877:422-1255(-)
MVCWISYPCRRKERKPGTRSAVHLLPTLRRQRRWLYLLGCKRRWLRRWLPSKTHMVFTKLVEATWRCKKPSRWIFLLGRGSKHVAAHPWKAVVQRQTRVYYSKDLNDMWVRLPTMHLPYTRESMPHWTWPHHSRPKPSIHEGRWQLRAEHQTGRRVLLTFWRSWQCNEMQVALRMEPGKSFRRWRSLWSAPMLRSATSSSDSPIAMSDLRASSCLARSAQPSSRPCSPRTEDLEDLEDLVICSTAWNAWNQRCRLSAQSCFSVRNHGVSSVQISENN